MSRIYFHTEDADAELRGSERAHMGVLCNDIMMASIGPVFDSERQPHWLRKLLPAESYIAKARPGDSFYEHALRSYLSVDGKLAVEDKTLDTWTIALNTALAVGDEPLRLLARLHGQCEIHAWVDGPNRAWLADAIERCRRRNLLRREQGCEGVVALLRKSDKGEVVTSYSVCDSFPGGERTWSDGIAELRSPASKNGLEIKPDERNYYFGHGVSALHLYDLANGTLKIGDIKWD